MFPEPQDSLEELQATRGKKETEWESPTPFTPPINLIAQLSVLNTDDIIKNTLGTKITRSAALKVWIISTSIRQTIKQVC